MARRNYFYQIKELNGHTLFLDDNRADFIRHICSIIDKHVDVSISNVDW